MGGKEFLYSETVLMGVSWENMKNKENAENMEKTENMNQITSFFNSFFIQNSLLVPQNTLLGNHMTQNTLSYGFYVDSQKNHNICARRT